MDLAKIRKKARLGQDAPLDANGEGTATAESYQVPRQRENTRPFDSAAVPAESGSDALLKEPESLRREFQPLPLCRDTTRSPLDIILAGRADAGCNEELQADPHDQIPSADEAFEEFLCIRVSDETYGISIMQIKEIITLPQVTEVPRAPAFVRGVISLRGVIIPILDMTDRLGLKPPTSTGRERVVVVKSGTADSFTGLLVNQVTHVARIVSNRIEPAPVPLNGIDRDFVRGIGRNDARLIILLNIESIIDFQLT
jgi:purine-binding chemotaxis protein CheW